MPTWEKLRVLPVKFSLCVLPSWLRLFENFFIFRNLVIAGSRVFLGVGVRVCLGLGLAIGALRFVCWSSADFLALWQWHGRLLVLPPFCGLFWSSLNVINARLGASDCHLKPLSKRRCKRSSRLGLGKWLASNLVLNELRFWAAGISPHSVALNAFPAEISFNYKLCWMFLALFFFFGVLPFLIDNVADRQIWISLICYPLKVGKLVLQRSPPYLAIIPSWDRDRHPPTRIATLLHSPFPLWSRSLSSTQAAQICQKLLFCSL